MSTMAQSGTSMLALPPWTAPAPPPRSDGCCGKSARVRYTLPAPTRNRATSSTGFCVADRPMRSSGRPHSASSRSSDSARWLPRLSSASAWISSTITLRTVPSIARPEAEPSSTYNDSGVVTRICGGLRRSLARSACGVSPVRTTARISTSGKPSSASAAPIPASGASRFRAMSLDSAFSGET